MRRNWSALREFEEETGIDRSQIKLDEEFLYEGSYRVKNWKGRGNVDKRLVIFLAKLRSSSSAKVVPTEHIGYQWVDWDPPHDIQEKTINPLLEQVAKPLSVGRNKKRGDKKKTGWL